MISLGNKIKQLLASGKSASLEEFEAEAAKIRAGWSAPQQQSPVVHVATQTTYTSPHAALVNQHFAQAQLSAQQAYAQVGVGAPTLQQALQNQYALQNAALGRVYATQIYASTGALGGLGAAYYEPPKYDPSWRLQYELERQRAADQREVEET